MNNWTVRLQEADEAPVLRTETPAFPCPEYMLPKERGRNTGPALRKSPSPKAAHLRQDFKCEVRKLEPFEESYGSGRNKTRETMLDPPRVR